MGFSLGWKYGAIFAAMLARAIRGRRSSFINSSRSASGSVAAISFRIVGVMDGRKLKALLDGWLDRFGKDAFGRAPFGNDGFGKEGFGSDGLVDDRFGNDRFGTTGSSRQREACCRCIC